VGLGTGHPRRDEGARPPPRHGSFARGFVTQALQPIQGCSAELQISLHDFFSEEERPAPGPALGGRRPGATDGSVPVRRRTAVAVAGFLLHPPSAPRESRRCPSTAGQGCVT
jgi:hypothetical protein